MLVGMGTVFVFLTTLIMAVLLMARIATRFQKEEIGSDIKPDEVAAITAAIARHRGS